MREEILKRLDEIEHEENVSIVYACESGSRAWGVESTDSDSDVRFVYDHQQNWYLSIDVEEKRDVVERPINDQLDISGWDLRKALELLRKSNPPLSSGSALHGLRVMDAPTHFILFKRIDFYYLPFGEKALVFVFVAASGFENTISAILESVKLPDTRQGGSNI